MNHGLSAETVAKISAVLGRFPQVKKALLYGSRAKGCARPGSDIDLTLVGDEIDYRLLGRIEDQLDDLLLPYRVSLSILAKISHPEFLAHVRRVGVEFYANDTGCQA